jgi:hypothetical protein
VVIAAALFVVLGGVLMVQLVRRIEPAPDFEAAPPPTVVVAPAPTAATLPPPPSAPPAPAASDTPAAPPAAPAAITDAPATQPLPGGPSDRFVSGNAPTAVDALDTVDDFRRAYEQRNLDRLGALFTADAHKGELVGRDAILADYQRFFTHARDLLYSQPSAAVEPRGDHVVVRAPFEITYKDAENRPIEVRGTAAWTLVRLDGATLIRSLDFEVSPVAAPAR